MIALRMIGLIETHSDQLARELIERFLNSEKMSDLRKVPLPELRHAPSGHDRARAITSSTSSPSTMSQADSTSVASRRALTDSAGRTGVGEVPGGEKIRQIALIECHSGILPVWQSDVFRPNG